MKRPREILLERHGGATPKLDAIRAGAVAGITRAAAPEGLSWRELARGLSWHLAAMSAAWVVVIILSIDHGPGAVAMMPREKMPSPEKIWASFRENRRLLLEYSEIPAAEMPALPGRRSEIQPRQEAV